MSPTANTDYDDKQLEQYVLGLLPAEMTERLDEQSVADDEIAVRLRTVETDLIDHYVRGHLDGETLGRFESYYLSSPRRREAVRRAASFVRAVDRSVAADSVTWKERIARPNRLKWVMAAAALATAIGGSLLFEGAPPRRELTPARPATGTNGRPVQQTAPSTDSDRARRGPAPQREMAAVVLQPPTRAVTPAPIVAIPAGVDRMPFELRLEAHDFPRYRIQLHDPASHQILWRSEWMPPMSSGGRTWVPAVVPVNLFRAQHYSLDLLGRDAAGREDAIGSYPVRIVQP